MYDLLIDMKKVRTEDTIKPLIEELDAIARGDGFQVAMIRYVDVEAPDCGHAAYGKAMGKMRCGMMTCDNYYMRHWTRGK